MRNDPNFKIYLFILLLTHASVFASDFKNSSMPIWKTVNPYMAACENVEAYKVIFSCLKP